MSKQQTDKQMIFNLLIIKQKLSARERKNLCFVFCCFSDGLQPEAVGPLRCAFSVLWLTSIHHRKSNVSHQSSRDVLGVSETDAQSTLLGRAERVERRLHCD